MPLNCVPTNGENDKPFVLPHVHTQDNTLGRDTSQPFTAEGPLMANTYTWAKKMYIDNYEGLNFIMGEIKTGLKKI